MCLNMYKLDPAYFVFEPVLVWQSCLKRQE